MVLTATTTTAGTGQPPHRHRRTGATATGSARAAVWAAAFGIASAFLLPEAVAAIYSCTDGNGKRLTSDRPIAECVSREQRVLNADGSMREVLPPTLTSEERSDLEQRQREAETARAVRQEAIRRDRNLLIRFPDVAAHDKAREAALDDARKSMQLSEKRLALLAAEKKPLLDESEFYVGKPMPGKLRAQLDANDASTAAQKNLIQNQQVEIGRINSLYDAELERLKRLWAGAQPGSMGQLPPSNLSLSPTSTLLGQSAPAGPAGPSAGKPARR